MSDSFNGMALYSKEEIGKALDNKRDLTLYCKKVTNAALDKAKDTETSYKRLGFLWSIFRTEFDDIKEDVDPFYGIYWYLEDCLFDRGYLDKKQRDICNLHLNTYKSTVKEITNLYNGGKDCYLNPEQAKFINSYKNLDIEEILK
tara:strand:+ start:665 stop:1099 length:435 start_codon:yes stop_codon:yes gene_type:complete